MQRKRIVLCISVVGAAIVAVGIAIIALDAARRSETAACRAITNFSVAGVNVSNASATRLGAHNSYRRRSPLAAFSAAWAIEQPPLGTQAQLGARHFEIDAHYNASLVYHVATFDERSTCRCFVECLAEIAQAVPRDELAFVFVELKDAGDTRLYADSSALLDAVAEVERVAALVFGARQLRPRDLIGEATTLGDAVAAGAWQRARERASSAYGPSLAVAVMCDTATPAWRVSRSNARSPLAANSTSTLFVLFVGTVTALAIEPSLALAAVEGDPRNPLVSELAARGVLVRVGADAPESVFNATRLADALASEAAFVATDFLVRAINEFAQE